jgi:hypothetical protein
MKRTLLLYSTFFILHSTFAQPANTNISSGVSFDGEPYIAVNPSNPQNMVIAWMGLTFVPTVRVSIKTKTSFDGGNTWGNLHTQSHLSNNTTSADVSMCFKNDGTLYISYIDSRQSPDSGVIYVAHSTDGGINWTAPTVAWNLLEDTVKKPIDRPWMVCDNSSTANYGMLYMSTKPVPWIPAPNRPYFKSSSDSGNTWSAYRYVDTTNYLVGSYIQAPMAAVATTQDGAVCTAYPSYVASQSIYPKVYLAKSYDKGAHFQYYDMLSSPVGAPDTNLKQGYCLVSDPINSNRMAEVYVGGQNGDADIFIITTNNGGVTWSNPVRVNDDAIGNGKHQDMPWASYNSAGRLVVTWRDRRNGTGTGFQQASDTYAALSTDNGASFYPNFRLSSMTAAFDSVLYQNGNDFMGCKLVGDTICATWGDVRTGKLNIFFAKASDSTGISAGVTEVASEETGTLTVYPNPASSIIQITLPFISSNAVLTLTDASGKIVFEKKAPKGEEQIDINGLARGIYYAIYGLGDIVYKQSLVIGQ